VQAARFRAPVLQHDLRVGFISPLCCQTHRRGSQRTDVCQCTARGCPPQRCLATRLPAGRVVCSTLEDLDLDTAQQRDATHAKKRIVIGMLCRIAAVDEGPCDRHARHFGT
jgi:hypothetical protein